MTESGFRWDIGKELLAGKKIALLTGAGISTAAGIPDFQTLTREWKYTISREEAMSVSYMYANPQNFWKIYQEVFGMVSDLQPTKFHRWAAELQNYAEEVHIITQNVDGLHQSAGSDNVIEIHGNAKNLIDENVLDRSVDHGVFEMDGWGEWEDGVPVSPYTGNILRPDTVLFGDSPRGYDEAKNQIEEADIFITAGTSLNVAPASQLPFFAMFSQNLPTTIWINKDLPPEDYFFTRKFLLDTELFAEKNSF